jgi:hypothetical protein
MSIRNAIQSGASLVALAMLCGSLLACATEPPKAKAKLKDPKALTPKKPDKAVTVGMKSTITPKDGRVKVDVPGDQAEVFSWEYTDDSGHVAQCEGAFVGASFAIVCSPYADKCEDGTAFQADLIMAYDESQHEGLIAIVGSNLCDSGNDVWACELDAAGNAGACVVGKLNADGEVELSE